MRYEKTGRGNDLDGMMDDSSLCGFFLMHTGFPFVMTLDFRSTIIS